MFNDEIITPAESFDERRPLTGRTIVITRALNQSKEFAAQLERLGARIVACPTIEIVEPESFALLDEAIENLYGYDWVIFTSVNGVEYFMRRLATAQKPVSLLDDLRVCAVGTATAERLADAQIHVDVVPENFQAEGVFVALTSYLGSVDALANLNFLIPAAAAARDYLPRELEKAGARVDSVPAYRTVRPETTDRARVEALLVGGGVDCITFTSSSTVINLARLFDTTDLSELLKHVHVACIGEITAQAAADYGLRTHIRPGESTALSLAQAIADFYVKFSS